MKTIDFIYWFIIIASVPMYAAYIFFIHKKNFKRKLRQLKDVNNGEFIMWTGIDYHTYDGCEVLNNDPLNKKMYVKFHHKPGSIPQTTLTILEYNCILLQDFQTLNTFQNIKFRLSTISEKERLQNLLKQYEFEENYEKAAEVKLMIDKLR